VKAVNERDLDQLCDELVTQDFIEKSTGASGDQAQEQCKPQRGLLKGVHLELVRIKSTTVDGDRARVRFSVAAQGQARDQVLRLEKEDGRFKIAG
jgi:hypothetical protein